MLLQELAQGSALDEGIPVANSARRMKRDWWIGLHAVLLMAIASAGILSFLEERRVQRELTIRLASIAATLEESLASKNTAKRPGTIARLAKRLESVKGLDSVVLCSFGMKGQWLKEFSSAYSIDAELSAPWQWKKLCLTPTVSWTLRSGEDSNWSARVDGKSFQVHSHRLTLQRQPDGMRQKQGAWKESQYLAQRQEVLILAHDLSFLREAWLRHFLRIFGIATLGMCLLVAVIRHQWVSRFHLLRAWERKRRPERAHSKPEAPVPSSLASSLRTRRLIVVANREPYIHERSSGDQIRIIRPASGLVTALEPILRHCGGLWIGHGSGNADAEVSGSEGEIPVPPEKPRYLLRRVWLTPEEETGYYYGFSNEGLWPLCHLAHQRPVFRLTDWNHYSQVNQRFCQATLRKGTATQGAEPKEAPLILVQDYHFALLPGMLRQALETKKHRVTPRIALFWHIPWPNPEAFGICPWGKELLTGMIGADVVGFHTHHHCINFLETCNRYLESRIDWERFSVTIANRETFVRPFPIGIDTAPVKALLEPERKALKERYGIRARWIAIGVDRIDYTKGLIERMEAVERFLEKYPRFVGEFCMIQVGSPSRTRIPAYQHFTSQLESTIARVNARFGSRETGKSDPILFLPEHHDRTELESLYQVAQTCLVTSLHDGMNLVAKEYVWCQQPENGALILSKFTGASRELTEAFIINPYSIEEMADALASALELSPEEKARRMFAMREKVSQMNAYHWASELIRALIATEAPALSRPLSSTPLSARVPVQLASLGGADWNQRRTR